MGLGILQARVQIVTSPHGRREICRSSLTVELEIRTHTPTLCKQRGFCEVL